MLTIREAFTQFYVPNCPDLGPRTHERYLWEIARWERHTGNPPINELTTDLFNRYRASCLAAGLKATTIEGGIRIVLQVLRLCGPESERRQGLNLIPRVPFVGRPLRQHAPMRPTPSVDELKMLCLFAGKAIWPKGLDTAAWWRAWIGTAFVTGLRLSDMLDLKATQLRKDVLTVRAAKTGAPHVFVLPDWLLTQLSSVAREQLLPSRRLPCFVRREIRRLSVTVGIPVVTPHGIRRASITAWSALSSDCGAVIHGHGLGIRDRYVDIESLLRQHAGRLPRLW